MKAPLIVVLVFMAIVLGSLFLVAPAAADAHPTLTGGPTVSTTTAASQVFTMSIPAGSNLVLLQAAQGATCGTLTGIRVGAYNAALFPSTKETEVVSGTTVVTAQLWYLSNPPTGSSVTINATWSTVCFDAFTTHVLAGTAFRNVNVVTPLENGAVHLQNSGGVPTGTLSVTFSTPSAIQTVAVTIASTRENAGSTGRLNNQDNLGTAWGFLVAGVGTTYCGPTNGQCGEGGFIVSGANSLSATDPDGNMYFAATETFINGRPPVVVTNPATLIGPTYAQLNGALTDIGAVVATPPVVYSCNNPFVGLPHLATFDVASGLTTDKGSMLTTDLCGDLAFDPSNNLYGVLRGTDGFATFGFYLVNQGTGAATLQWTISNWHGHGGGGLQNVDVEDLTVRRSDGSFFGVVDYTGSGGPSLFSLNTIAHTATVIGKLNVSTPRPEGNGLAFSPSGSLIHVGETTASPPGPKNVFYSVDPTTGAETRLASADTTAICGLHNNAITALAYASDGTLYGSLTCNLFSGEASESSHMVRVASSFDSLTDLGVTTIETDGIAIRSSTGDTVFFQWGLTSSLGTSTTGSSQYVTGPFSETVATLSPDKTYFFRACANDGTSLVCGVTLFFHTSIVLGLDWWPLFPFVAILILGLYGAFWLKERRGVG